MNVGEYGNVLRLNANYDMSTNISLGIEITHPNGTKTSHTPTLGTSDIATPLGTFYTDKYVEYTFLSGDITMTGSHVARLIYDKSATVKLIGEKASFDVAP